MKYLLIIFLLLFSFGCQPGEVVDASQLNENYQSRAIRSAGNIIGVRTDNSVDGLTFNPNFEPVQLLNTGGIEVSFLKEGQLFDAIYFAKLDCTGDRYVLFSDYPFPENKFLFGPPKGRIFRDQSTDALYYYAPDVQAMYAKISLSYRVVYHSGLIECHNPSVNDMKIMIKLLPNDPAITGLPNTPFPTPITFDGINEAVIIQE